MKLYYEPSAKAFHHHLLTEEDLPKKMRAVGQSAAHFEKLHPEINVLPKGFKLIVLRLACAPLALKIWELLDQSLYFKFRSWRGFLDIK